MQYLLYWFATYGLLTFTTTILLLVSNKVYEWVNDNPTYVYPTMLLVSTIVSIFHNYLV